jgi:hypothetical protein
VQACLRVGVSAGVTATATVLLVYPNPTKALAAQSSSSGTSMSSAAVAGTFRKSPQWRWAVAGWGLFVAENTLLSENRTYLIQQLGGEEQYHMAYGLCSTAATASIAYGYYVLTRGAHAEAHGSVHPAAFRGTVPPIPRLVASWTLLSLGLVMASQALPKLQIPVALVDAPPPESTDRTTVDTTRVTTATTPIAGTPTPTAAAPSRSYQFQIRCPFDFTDQSHHKADGAAVVGLDRVSRHPGLWSFAAIGLGVAGLQRSVPLALWWTGPAAVAWIGGAHQDSRFRRGLGGHYDPVYASQTSNLPMVALLTGQQGNVTESLTKLLGSELKLLNALGATAAAAVFVLSRGRRRV